MVIQSDEKYQERKALEAKMQEGDEVKKDRLFAEMRKYSTSLLTLSLLYAKNFEETGADITKKWMVAMEQNEILQRVFNKGYEEGIEKGREIYLEELKRKEEIEKTRQKEEFRDIKVVKPSPASVISVDEFIRQNTVQQPHRNVVQPTDAQHRRKGTKKRRKR